jgi:large subunit ribosomal protein L1
MPIDIDAAEESIKQAKEKGEDRNFRESIDAIVNLRDIDVKDQQNRITTDVFLPKGTGKKSKVCVIGRGDLALHAKEAGVDVLTQDDLNALGKDRKKVKSLASEYDYFLAQVDMMPLVGRTLGSVLGPRGKMPKPVPPTADLDEMLKSLSSTISIRTQRGQPVVNSCIGTVDMDDRDLAVNLNAVVEAVERNLPRGRENIRSVVVKKSMGSPVEVTT